MDQASEYASSPNDCLMSLISKHTPMLLPTTKPFTYWSAVGLVGVVSIFQVVWIDAAFSNVCAVLMVFSAVLSSILYFKHLRISYYPNSFLILLGFVLGPCLLPLLLRTVSGTSLVDGLHEPLLTFGSIYLFVIVSLISHYVYTKTPLLISLRNAINKKLRPFLNPSITPFTAIAIASIGLMALFIKSASDGVLSKLLSALVPLANIPLAIFLVVYLKSQSCPEEKRPSRLLLGGVIVFYALSVIIGIIFNSRIAFVEPLILVFCVLCYKRLALSLPFGKGFLVGVVLAMVIAFPLLNNLSASIALARAYRSTVSPAELFSMTIDNITQAKPEDLVYDKRLWWDEQYYRNEFMNRFSPIKMIDNTLYIQQRMDQTQISQYQTYQFIRLISTLPNPLPSFFGVSGEMKEDVNQYSSADVQFGFISESTKGRRLTGSFISDLYILFGPLASVALYGGLLLMVFPLTDVFVTQLRYRNDVVIPSSLGILLGSDNLLYFSNSSLVEMSVSYLRLILEVSFAFFLLNVLVNIIFRLPRSGPSL